MIVDFLNHWSEGMFLTSRYPGVMFELATHTQSLQSRRAETVHHHDFIVSNYYTESLAVLNQLNASLIDLKTRMCIFPKLKVPYRFPWTSFHSSYNRHNRSRQNSVHVTLPTRNLNCLTTCPVSVVVRLLHVPFLAVHQLVVLLALDAPRAALLVGHFDFVPLPRRGS